jgi:hypothetical protein
MILALGLVLALELVGDDHSLDHILVQPCIDPNYGGTLKER